MITLDARLAALSSPDLLAALERTAAQGREVTADLIALLAECDARQLYAAEGYSSLYEFCVARLRLSEAQAYHRIQAARAAHSFPLVLERLRAGRVTMTAVALLREHLTDDNHRAVLEWAEGRSKREVEVFVRGIDPKPDVPTSLRRLAPSWAQPAVAVATERPASTHEAPPSAVEAAESPAEAAKPVLAAPLATAVAGGITSAPLETSREPPASAGARTMAGAAPGRRAEIHPLAPARYSLRLTISQGTCDKLRRAQELLRHAGADDPALVLDRALTLLVAHLERRKAGARSATRINAAPTAARTLPETTRSPEGRDEHPGHGADASNDGAGDDAEAVGEALDAPERTRTAAGPSLPPSPVRSRYIPAAVRRLVWDRDRGRCAYVSPRGVRCAATAGLEFHHRIPFAEGGPSTVQNLALACTRHNSWEAKRWFNSDWAESEGGALQGARVWRSK